MSTTPKLTTPELYPLFPQTPPMDFSDSILLPGITDLTPLFSYNDDDARVLDMPTIDLPISIGLKNSLTTKKVATVAERTVKISERPKKKQKASPRSFPLQNSNRLNYFTNVYSVGQYKMKIVSPSSVYSHLGLRESSPFIALGFIGKNKEKGEILGLSNTNHTFKLKNVLDYMLKELKGKGFNPEDVEIHIFLFTQTLGAMGKNKSKLEEDAFEIHNSGKYNVKNIRLEALYSKHNPGLSQTINVVFSKDGFHSSRLPIFTLKKGHGGNYLKTEEFP